MPAIALPATSATAAATSAATSSGLAQTGVGTAALDANGSPLQVKTETATAATEATEATTEVEETRLERIKRDAQRARKSAQRERLRASELSASQSRIRELEAKAQRGEAIENSLKQNPLDALALAGHDPNDLVRRALQAGSPEEQINELRRLVNQQAEAAKKSQEAAEKQARETHFESVRESYWKLSRDEARFPNLQHFDRKDLLVLGNAAGKEYRDNAFKKYGTDIVPSNKQILAYLNKKYDPKTRSAGQSTDQKATAGSTSNGTATDKKAAYGTTTLTNGLGTSTFTVPPNWDAMPRAEREHALKEGLRAARLKAGR